jgi:hypothetical protein
MLTVHMESFGCWTLFEEFVIWAVSFRFLATRSSSVSLLIVHGASCELEPSWKGLYRVQLQLPFKVDPMIKSDVSRYQHLMDWHFGFQPWTCGLLGKGMYRLQLNHVEREGVKQRTDADTSNLVSIDKFLIATADHSWNLWKLKDFYTWKRDVSSPITIRFTITIGQDY